MDEVGLVEAKLPERSGLRDNNDTIRSWIDADFGTPNACVSTLSFKWGLL